jgi:hypothetical protein
LKAGDKDRKKGWMDGNMKQKIRYFRVTVEFLLEKFSCPARLDRDRYLEKVVGRESDGAGTDFSTRDLSWSFRLLKPALKAFQSLQRVRWLSKCEISRTND